MKELVAFVDDNSDFCFSQGSVVKLLSYKDSTKFYYVDFTVINKSVEYDGTVESLKSIIQDVYSRLN